MKLSTKGQYAVRAMLDLALHYGEGPVLLKDVAKRQEISERYLEHLITPLKTAGLVKSARGAHGGFTLAKPPSEIKLADIIQITEGPIAVKECVDNPKACLRVPLCATRDIWSEVNRAINEVLESTTLQGLVEQQRKKEQPETAMYYI